MTSSRRSSALPDVPTFEQAGGSTPKNFKASSWFSPLAPAGTPSDIVNRIQQEVAKSLNTPAFKEKLFEAEGQVSILFGYENCKRDADDWDLAVAGPCIEGCSRLAPVWAMSGHDKRRESCAA